MPEPHQPTQSTNTPDITDNLEWKRHGHACLDNTSAKGLKPIGTHHLDLSTNYLIDNDHDINEFFPNFSNDDLSRLERSKNVGFLKLFLR